jgi:hypothetical protein
MDRLRGGALLLTLAVLFAPQSAAWAATQQHSGHVWVGKRCAFGQVWVSTDWGLPGLESIATIDSSNAGQCDNTAWTTRQGEAIAVRQTLVAWDARGWEFECNVGPWLVENRIGFHQIHTWWVFNRPCNTNWYRGETYPGVFYDGTWHLGFQKFGLGIKTGWVFQG